MRMSPFRSNEQSTLHRICSSIQIHARILLYYNKNQNKKNCAEYKKKKRQPQKI